MGYGIYDLYDLGEFDQKGDVRTKYGTKAELHLLIDAIHEAGMQVYADVVINHKAGADREEEFEAVKVDYNDRNKEIEEPRMIKGWTGFDFPGRGEQYSAFKWNHNHFSGVDYDSKNQEGGIFKIIGENKGWSWGVSKGNGNFDYLMFADIDHAHPDVKKELITWIDWFIKELNLDGLRFDAVKHIDSSFMEEFATHLKETHGNDFYLLGEYWDASIDSKIGYMHSTDYQMALFDVSLHFKFYQAAKNSDAFDLRDMFNDTVTGENPPMSVTFVDNHDSERGMIDPLAIIRKKYAYGDQDEYFNEQHLIGWLRHGNEDYPHKLAVVISLKEKRSIRMFFGKEQVGKVYIDALGHVQDQITIDDEGFGEVWAEAGGISCWLEEEYNLD